MTTLAVKPTNHAMIRLQERFPREWKQLGFESCHKSTLHLSATNLKLIRKLLSEAKKVNSIINDKAMAVYFLERFGCSNPSFYVKDNIVFVIRSGLIITVMDKQKDARNHIKGFEASSSKKKKTEANGDELSSSVYLTEGSFLNLIKENSILLTYTHIMDYSSEYELVLASFKDKEMYYLRSKDSRKNSAPLFFKTSAEKAQLNLLRAWATALATHEDPLYLWIREGSAQVEFKYSSNLWVYTVEFERTVLTFSWNPIIQKGSILDYPIHKNNPHGTYIDMTTYKYIKLASSGQATRICAVAYNRFLYKVIENDQSIYFIYEPGTNYWQQLDVSSRIGKLLSCMESYVLPWVEKAIQKSSFQVYKRTQRDTDTYLINDGSDSGLEFEFKLTKHISSSGATEEVWIVSPLMALYVCDKYFRKELGLTVESIFSEILMYSVQLQHDKRAYAIVDNEGQEPICSVEIGGLDYYYKVSLAEMHKVHHVYSYFRQPGLRALYQNINLIKAQLNSWIESGKASVIKCDLGGIVAGVEFDGHFFIFEKLNGHSHFSAIHTDEFAYKRYKGWHQALSTALHLSPATRILTYVKKNRRTHVYSLDVPELQERFSTYYSKWSKEYDDALRNGQPPLYFIQVEGESPRLATRGEYGEILQHELATKALLESLSAESYEEIEFCDTYRGHLTNGQDVSTEAVSALLILKIKVPPSREVIVSVDAETEALQATREDFMVIAHWYRHKDD